MAVPALGWGTPALADFFWTLCVPIRLETSMKSFPLVVLATLSFAAACSKPAPKPSKSEKSSTAHEHPKVDREPDFTPPDEFPDQGEEFGEPEVGDQLADEEPAEGGEQVDDEDEVEPEPPMEELDSGNDEDPGEDEDYEDDEDVDELD